MPVPQLRQEACFKPEAHEVFVLGKRTIQEFQRYLLLEREMLSQVDLGIATSSEFAKQQVASHPLSS
jgi:hypothetical protein